MRYLIGFLVVVVLVIGGFLLITGMSDALGIAATVADTENIEALTGLTQEETDREVVDLLGELVEQSGEQAEYQRMMSERYLQVIEDLSRPNNTLLIVLGVAVATLGALSAVTLVVLVMVVARQRSGSQLSQPSLLAHTSRAALEEGQWRMVTGEYMEVPELVERRG